MVDEAKVFADALKARAPGLEGIPIGQLMDKALSFAPNRKLSGAETVITIPISVGEVGVHDGGGEEGGPEE